MLQQWRGRIRRKTDATAFGQRVLMALLVVCFLLNTALLSWLSIQTDGGDPKAENHRDIRASLFRDSVQANCSRNRVEEPPTRDGGSTTDNTIRRNSNVSSPPAPCSSPDCYKTPKNQIAVCLQFKDDNNRLPEWIAYHYYTLPMRHLSIMIDPNSFTSPQSILDQWNGTDKMGMHIRVWNDEEVFLRPNDKSYIGKLNFTTTAYEKLREMHRARQRHFSSACMSYYAELGIKWVLLIDVDEYMTYNPVYADEPHHSRSYRFDNTTGKFRIRKPAIKALAKDYRSELYDEEKSIQNILLQRLTLPRIDQRKIADYIDDHSQEHPWLDRLRPCKVYPRLTIGPDEPTAAEQIIGDDLDEHFNSSNFDTLRFFHHGIKGRFDHNYFGKALVDVSSSRSREFLRRYDQIPTIHQPLDDLCGDDVIGQLNASLFVVFHYTGSEEAFFFKPDKRRTKARFELRRVNNGVNYDIKPWLRGFVNEVGLDKAKQLLAKAGYLGTREEVFPDVDYYGANDTRPDEHKEMEEDDDYALEDDSIQKNGERNGSFPLKVNLTVNDYRKAENSVAVCLVCRNGSDQYLSEWLAYHYTILPLRRLTILMDNDGSDKASAMSILERWNGTSRMGIDVTVVWTNDTTVPRDGTAAERSVTVENRFCQRCLNTYLTTSAQFLLYLEVDDYLLFNTIHEEEKGYYHNFDFDENAEGPKKKLRLTSRATRMVSAGKEASLALSELQSRLHLPALGSKTATSYLRRKMKRPHWKDALKPCRFVPRRSYLEIVEERHDEHPFLDAGLAAHFDPKQFRTLRNSHYVERGQSEDRYGSALVDLEKSRDLLKSVNRTLSADELLDMLCINDHYGDQNYSTFVINHYARSSNRLHDKSTTESISTYADGDIRPWLSSFARAVGVEKAKELLSPR